MNGAPYVAISDWDDEPSEHEDTLDLVMALDRQILADHPSWTRFYRVLIPGEFPADMVEPNYGYVRVERLADGIPSRRPVSLYAVDPNEHGWVLETPPGNISLN